MERGRRRIRFDLERLGYAFGFLSLGLAIHEAWKKARKKVENEEIPLEVQAEEDGSLTASFFRGRFPEPVEELRKINEEIVEGYNRLWIQWQEALEANEALELDCKMWQRRLKDTQDEMFALRREIEELRKKLEGSNVRLSVDFETRLRARRLSHAEADKETPMTEERGDGLDALRKEAKLLRHAIQEIERGSLLHVSELETPKSRNSLLARTRSPFQRLNRRFDKENIQ